MDPLINAINQINNLIEPVTEFTGGTKIYEPASRSTVEGKLKGELLDIACSVVMGYKNNRPPSEFTNLDQLDTYQTNIDIHLINDPEIKEYQELLSKIILAVEIGEKA